MRIAFALIIALSAPSSAQDWYPRGRIIGSVEIPALHDRVNQKSGDARSGPVTLYSQPLEGAEPATIVADRVDIESLEHSYEQVSAGVLEVKLQGEEKWYLVQYKVDGEIRTAWLSQRDAGQFRLLSEMLHPSLAFLTDAWDGVLYKAPRRDAPHQTVPKLGDRPSVAVASVRGQPQQLWLLVVILDRSICDDGPQSVIAAGWIPAHSATGKLTAWHYSRGC